jgi:cysteine desulfurase
VSDRVYLDWNATAPLRPQARAAMAAAMDIVGNPSSVHAEGRAPVRQGTWPRGALAEALGAGQADIVWTSGATEGAALALAGRGFQGSAVEHEAIAAWVDPVLQVDDAGQVTVPDPSHATLQLANSETGVVQVLPPGLAVSDVTQGVGRVPFAYSWSGLNTAILSAHKFGGPKGVGALVIPRGADLASQLKGGGQEMGRRAGTENIIGIAGMAAAATAALAELADGTWDRVAQLRDLLEETIADLEPETIFVGKAAVRLPNTTCMITAGWKGETQVMAMDLAGFAISAGSACSSGKVRASKVLMAMGFDGTQAASAVRVSLGPATTKDQVLRFAAAWGAARRTARARAA